MLIGAGLIFQLPVLSLLLSIIGILTPAFMRHYRRHSIIIILGTCVIFLIYNLLDLRKNYISPLINDKISDNKQVSNDDESNVDTESLSENDINVEIKNNSVVENKKEVPLKEN